MTTTVRPTVRVVTDDGELAALWPAWDRLLAESDAATSFLTSAWLGAWRATIGRDHELAVTVAMDPASGALLGAAPFAVETRRIGLRHRALVFLGQGRPAPDRLDLVLHPGAASVTAPLLWHRAVRAAAPDLIDLDGLRADSVVAGLALRRARDQRYVTATVAPVLDLPPTWEDYERSLGKNLRQNLRRYARKLDREAGAPVIERMVTDRAEVELTIDALAALHQSVRTGRGDRGSFDEPALRSFHRAAALGLHDAGRLRLHRLDVDGRAVAVIYCFRHGDTVAFYSTGYDTGFARYGPGRRIMAVAIRAAIDEGATRFDFLRGDEEYKAAWGTEDAPLTRILRPTSPRGRLLWLGAAALGRLGR